MSESKVLKRQTSTVSSLTCILKKGWSTFESSFSNLVHSVESTGCLKIIGYFNAIDICDCCPRARRCTAAAGEKILNPGTGSNFLMAHGAWQPMSQSFISTLLTAHPQATSVLISDWSWGIWTSHFYAGCKGCNTKARSSKFRSWCLYLDCLP